MGYQLTLLACVVRLEKPWCFVGAKNVGKNVDERDEKVDGKKLELDGRRKRIIGRGKRIEETERKRNTRVRRRKEAGGY